MILWPKQLEAIQGLAAKEGLSTVELIALPLRIRCTISTRDGPWTMYDIDHDGKITEVTAYGRNEGY